jgi:hypothetical protein
MLYLFIHFSWHNLMSVTDKVCYDCMPIITASCQNFKTRTYRYRIATSFMLFHNISNRTFCILRGVLIMYKNFSAHRYRNYSPQILISLIIELTCIATPKCKPRNCLLVFLEIFHSCSISDIYCEYTTSTVSYK